MASDTIFRIARARNFRDKATQKHVITNIQDMNFEDVFKEPKKKKSEDEDEF